MNLAHATPKHHTANHCRNAELPILAPASEIMQLLWSLGWVSHEQIVSAYGKVGQMAIVFLRQIKVVNQKVRKVDGKLQQCYSIADKRFSSASPQEMMAAMEQCARRAGIKI